MRIRLREEGIKIMEQPKYRFEDLHLQSDKEYLDIKEQLANGIAEGFELATKHLGLFKTALLGLSVVGSVKMKNLIQIKLI